LRIKYLAWNSLNYILHIRDIFGKTVKECLLLALFNITFHVETKNVSKRSIYLMDNENLYGIIIRTSDIKASRRFYMNVLMLGEPVLDSNFWLEFALPDDGGFLFVEASPAPPVMLAGYRRMPWVYQPRDPEEVLASLEKAGYDTEVKVLEQGNMKLHRVTDPDDNIFFVAESE